MGDMHALAKVITIKSVVFGAETAENSRIFWERRRTRREPLEDPSTAPPRRCSRLGAAAKCNKLPADFALYFFPNYVLTTEVNRCKIQK